MYDPSARTQRRYRFIDLIGGLRWQVQHQVLLLLARFARRPASAARYAQYLHRSELRKQSGPLNAEEVEQICQEQIKMDATASKRWKATFAPSEISKSASLLRMQARAAKLVDGVIRKHPDIRVVANIGARVDLASEALAQMHPQVTFYSVDFQRNLAEHNAGLRQSANWRFLSGYALDLVRNGNLKADLIFFTGTAFLFNNTELDAFLDAFAESKVRFIVLNEALFPDVKSLRYGFKLPENIPIDDPYVSGASGQYMHNYLLKLERHGYRIVSSELLPVPFFETATRPTIGSVNLQIVAELETLVDETAGQSE